MIVFTAAALMALTGAAVSWMRGKKPDDELPSATEPTVLSPLTSRGPRPTGRSGPRKRAAPGYGYPGPGGVESGSCHVTSFAAAPAVTPFW